MSENSTAGSSTAESSATENAAIRQQPNGDVDIAVPDAEVSEVMQSDEVGHEPSTDPENLDHPEELMGE